MSVGLSLSCAPNCARWLAHVEPSYLARYLPEELFFYSMFLSHVITSSSLHIDHQVHFGPLLLEYEPSLLELIKFLDHKQQIPHFCRASQQKKLESPTLAHHMVPPNWTKIAVAPRRIRLQKVQLSSSSSEDPEVDGTDAVIEKDRCNRIKQRSRKKS